LSNGRQNNPFDFAFNELIFFSFDDYKRMTPFYRNCVKILMSPYILFTALAYIKFAILQRFYVITFFFAKYLNTPSLPYLLTEQVFNNVAIAGIVYLQYKYSILYHCAVSMVISSGVGAFLFFNQHTYNPAYVVDDANWSLKDSGLKGSSFIKIPCFLEYFTGGIEYHHIHHYDSRIPNYNLKSLHNEVVETIDLFDTIVVLSLADCWNNTSLALYDEENKRYITFEEADRLVKIG
jgi:omega-6 fatty acid desaturase (delta-12 desaturase)